MSDQNTKNSISSKTQEAEVLYQKLGGKWYGYAIVNDDLYMGQVPEECIFEDELTHKVVPSFLMEKVDFNDKSAESYIEPTTINDETIEKEI